MFESLNPGDKLYLRDITAVFGHVFVGFLCLYPYCQILNRIKQAGMAAHLSSQGLLQELSKVYAVENREKRQNTETAKQVRKIADKLELDYSLMDESLGLRRSPFLWEKISFRTPCENGPIKDINSSILQLILRGLFYNQCRALWSDEWAVASLPTSAPGSVSCKPQVTAPP